MTGALLFENGCWVVSSGNNRIAVFFPREARLLNKDVAIGARRLREGETYKFVGDLSETAEENTPTCNKLPSSIAAGDVWPAKDEQPQWKDSRTPAPSN